MIRKSKALGLAFAAVLAMSAFAASAAQALPTVSTTTSPVSVHGTGEAVGEKFVTEGGTVECKVSHYTGTVENGSSTVRLTPTYTECKAFGFLSATVTTNECHYLFHLTERVEPDWYKAHVDVECTNGKVITIVASTCEATVGSQTNLTTVDITDMTAPTSPVDLTIKPTLTSEGVMNGKNGPIAYTVTKDGIGCPFSGTGAKTGGEYSTEGYITGTAASGKLEVIGS